MKIAIAASNGKLVSSEDGAAPLTANRTAVGPWEIFTVLTQDEHGNWIPLEPPVPDQPQPSSVPPWVSYAGSAEAWFGLVVAGKPFGQQTLLDAESLLNANGWALTPPSSAGDRTKVLPGGEAQWVRVGFGEGYWVWVVQPL